MSFTVVSTMKNEGPFLLEWVAHHKVIGFDHMVVCWNDCSDGTDRMLARLTEMGIVTQHPTAIRKGGIQRSALRQARTYPEVQNADWVYVCDADEFLNIHAGDHSVRALVEASAGADVISVPWRIFGSGGVEGYEDAPVTTRFRRCEMPFHPATNPKAGHQVKSLFTGQDRFKRYGLHVPVLPDEGAEAFRIARPGGALVTDSDPSFAVAQVNHYILRSMDSYLVKRDRGRANHMDDVLGLEYWRKWNRNATEEGTIDRYRAATDALVAEYKADPVLGPLHEAAVAWHRAKIAEMRTRPEVQEIMPEMQATLYGQDDPTPIRTEAA